MRRAARLARLLLALSAALSAAALAGDWTPAHQLAWKQWTVAEGLPQITVNAVLQDRDGYLWVGTQDGVARFDGLRFEGYGLAEHPGLGHSVVHALALDAEGALWIGTMAGVARLHEGRIEPVATESADDPTGIVLALARDTQGRILVAARHGLFRSEGGRLQRIDTGLGKEPAVAVVVADDGTLLAVMPAHLVVDPEGERRIIALDGRLPSALSALRTDEGLWLGTIGGLFLLDDEGRPRAVHAPQREVERLAVDAEGTLWAATDQGLWWRRPGEPARPVDVPGIDHRVWVRSLFLDREGSLWVGTQLSGLHRAHAARFRRLGPRDGLPEGAVWAVYEAPDGEIWAGTPDGVYRGGLGGFRAAVPVDSLPHPMVVGLLKDRQGGMWFGTRYGLAHLPAGASLPQAVPAVGEEMIGALLEDHDGSVLAGGMNGLFRIGADGIRREPLPGPGGGSNVNALIHDGDGRVWAGHEQGIAVHDSGQWQAAAVPHGVTLQPMSLSAFDAGGMLVASFEGLYRVSADGAQRLDHGHGLHIDWVTWTRVLGDELWYLSVRGIGRVPLKALQQRLAGGGDAIAPRVFGDFGAALLAQCNGGHQAAGALTEARWLWCPSLDGLLVLDLARVAREEPGPTVRIEQLSSPLRQLAPRTDGMPLKLSAEERDLRLDYTALSLRAPEQVRFEGRLVGYDRDWLPLDTRRSAFYTNLAPGTYRFELRALSEDGVRGEPTSVALRVAPHWHETLTARLSAVLLLVLAIWGLMRGRLHLLQRQRERLALEVTARTRDLEAANRQLEQASLTDPLTGLNNRRFLGQHLPAEIARMHRRIAQGERHGVDLLFLHVDLDHFKAINDRYGHAVGDEVLVEIARRLQALARGSDLVLRWGGEEFLLVGPGSDRDQAGAFARRVLEAIRGAPVSTRAGALSLSASLGYAAYPALAHRLDGPGWEQVLDLADAATYLAKREGRDRAVGLQLQRSMDSETLGRRLHADPLALEVEGWIRIER